LIEGTSSIYLFSSNEKVQGYETPIKRGKANLSKLANQEEGAIIPDDFGS